MSLVLFLAIIIQEAISVLGYGEEHHVSAASHAQYVSLLQCWFLHLPAWFQVTISGGWIAPYLHTDGSFFGILLFIRVYSSSLLSFAPLSGSGFSNRSWARCSLKSRYLWVFFAGWFRAVELVCDSNTKICDWSHMMSIFDLGWHSVKAQQLHATHGVISYDCWSSHLNLCFVFVLPFVQTSSGSFLSMVKAIGTSLLLYHFVITSLGWLLTTIMDNRLFFFSYYDDYLEKIITEFEFLSLKRIHPFFLFFHNSLRPPTIMPTDMSINTILLTSFFSWG